MAELQKALAALKNHKAAGPDAVLPEMLKHMGPAGDQQLLHVIQRAWHARELPHDWQKSIIVPLLKKGDPSECGNYRGISLLSVPSKVLALVILDRCKGWMNDQLLEQQSGFRPARGCNDAIFCLRALLESAAERHTRVCIAFVDLSKAYDSVDRSLMFQVLEKRGMPTQLIDMLRCLHANTETCVRTSAGDSDWFHVDTGLRQGGVEAPLLFNLFLDTAVREVHPILQQLGVKIHYRIDGHLTEAKTYSSAELMWILMYADDIALICDDPDDLQLALSIVHKEFLRWGLHINASKTEVFANKEAIDSADHPLTFCLGDKPIATVQKFKYLGSIVTHDNSLDAEISNRIRSAADAFGKLCKIGFWSDPLTIRLKSRIYMTNVHSRLLYGSETWAVTQAHVHRLEVFQMSCLRRMLRLSLLDKRPNASIRKQCHVPAIAESLQQRRLVWLGHLGRMKDDRLPKQMLFGRVAEGGRQRGRPKQTWKSRVLTDLADVKVSRWYQSCQDRPGWRRKVKAGGN